MNMNTLLGYWYGLNSRERTLVAAAAAVVLVFAGYAGVWRPLDSGVAALQHRVDEQRRLEQWMQQSSEEVARLRARGGAADARGSLLATVERTSRQQGLREALKRVEPESSGKVRLQLEEAEFDKMIQWLELLATQHAVYVDTLSVDRRGAGRVNVRLTLAGGDA